ncbi:MAG: hypothetical protein AAGN46_07135 [Acidobacteriota bacterium]
MGLAIVLASCTTFERTPTPMRTVQITEPADAGECAVVLLPGTFDRAETFGAHGFDDIANDLGLDLELVAADANRAYYRQQVVLERLREDAILPLRRAGKRVWIVGVSLGGVGALLYARDHVELGVEPTAAARLAGDRATGTDTEIDDVDGLVLLAPYLGDDVVIEELLEAQGLKHWTPSEPVAAEDFGRHLWLWLKRWQRADPETRPAIHLAFGDNDRFAVGNVLLSRELDPRHVHVAAGGGHDWDTWTPLWRRLLASGTFDVCRASTEAGA